MTRAVSKRPASLTRRLILWLTLGASGLWLCGALAAAAILQHQLEAAFDAGLRETAERLLPLAAESIDGGARDSDESHEIPVFDARDGEYIVYQVRNTKGQILVRSYDAPLEPFNAALANGFSEDDGWRVLTIGTPDGRLFIHVAEQISHRAETLFGSIATLILPIAALIPLSGIGIFLIVRAALRPLTAFSAEISRRDARNLAPIETGSLPTELAPTGAAVQALIARLAAAFEAERSLAANSAHELRTPIAGSLAQTQRLLAELKGQPAEARARQVEDSLRRLRRLSEKLLQLARADSGMSSAAEPRDLLPALRLVVDDARRPMANPRRLTLDIAADASLLSPVDVDAFGIAMRNLLENALVHGDVTMPVTVSVPADRIVTVTNAGPPVAPDRLALLTRRFERGDTRAEGSGLGLAIVDQIMNNAGGELRLASPAPGRTGGFEARLILPEADHVVTGDLKT
ncbi:sensor histidine kinase N-terminal domain-containing protein [Mesorhizobium sp. BR1-1-16]|uniref:sensor histidine kinase n=1 Tax=Mesorhizobium sp. BR1-1-16 TaxID=2876653 RepID=UPI001CCC2CD2|nr:ATP-binding protein [Mesorhizobium sp. BR1-1-16]MBZ9936555.1 sensor histidine kinase N-terminal domain-containing protein [Mesorhizobium sp. BR1-1-16]